MRVLIDIPEEMYKNIKSGLWCGNNTISNAVANGTPLPDNATNERMVGKWIKSRDCYGNHHFTCSECGNEITTRYADNWEDKYCSECGARMEGMEYEKGYIL